MAHDTNRLYQWLCATFSVPIFYCYCSVLCLSSLHISGPFLSFVLLNCRKKRKWDQPAEALVSPAMSMPLMQLGGANPLASFGMPNMMTMMGGYVGLPMASVNASAASPLPPNNSAAAIVQKINQVQPSRHWLLSCFPASSTNPSVQPTCVRPL